MWVAVNVSCVRDEDDKPLYLIGQIEDVTEGRALRERLAFAAIHDSLTPYPTASCSWTVSRWPCAGPGAGTTAWP